MRFCIVIAFLLSTLGCSQPRLDLHLIRGASSPIEGELVESPPCEHCAAYSLVGHGGTKVDLRVERDPYLSIPANRLSDAEIVHQRGLYQPYCDNFSLLLRVRTSLAEIAEIVENFGGLPTVAIIQGQAVDAGRHIFQGETLSLTFADRQRAIRTAELIGASPIFLEADDDWQKEARQRDLENLKKILENPEELRRFAEETGLQPEDLKKEDFAAQLFCP